MTRHILRLADEPFAVILDGSKTIESRLYDEKRQLLQLGDTLVFARRDGPDQQIIAEVIGLLRYASFHELFSHSNPAKFGGESVEWLEDQINQFYSAEEQSKWGVIGIEFVVRSTAT